jgi:hypothetical protein
MSGDEQGSGMVWGGCLGARPVALLHLEADDAARKDKVKDGQAERS